MIKCGNLDSLCQTLWDLVLFHFQTIESYPMSQCVIYDWPLHFGVARVEKGWQGTWGLYVCEWVWGQLIRAPTAIFIEFHLDGHKPSLRPYWAATRENGTNTNMSSNPLCRDTSRSFVLKFDCEFCTEACINTRSRPLLRTLVRFGMQSEIHTHLETCFQLMHYREIRSHPGRHSVSQFVLEN